MTALGANSPDLPSLVEMVLSSRLCQPEPIVHQRVYGVGIFGALGESEQEATQLKPLQPTHEQTITANRRDQSKPPAATLREQVDAGTCVREQVDAGTCVRCVLIVVILMSELTGAWSS
jgi:hypothetical protein